MPGRIRNTKELARRIDRSYLNRLFPIPLWRRILTAGCLAIGLAWLGIYAIARNQTPYSAGPLTRAHSFVGKRCVVCHGGPGGMGERVTDTQCATCHDAPIHNLKQTFNPKCVECHVEHRGALQLAGGGDQGCVSCHGNLKTKNGQTEVARSINGFDNHPEFAAVRAGTNPVGIRFSHAKHVGELSQKCGDCHVRAARATDGSALHSTISSRAQMQIPTYAGTCMPCHALSIDDKIPDPAPHDKPAVVHQFVSDQVTKYIAAHPEDLGKDGTAGNAAAWVKLRIAADEKQLWETTCARCHEMGPADASGFPSVPAANIAVRRFPKASFDHLAHQALTCLSCHPAAAKSTSAASVMLPGIDVCRQCHNAEKSSAGSNCSTCHVYHDWSKEKGVDGKYKIEQMTEILRPYGGG